MAGRRGVFYGELWETGAMQTCEGRSWKPVWGFIFGFYSETKETRYGYECVGGVSVGLCWGAFVNAGKPGHAQVDVQANVDALPNVDILGFLLCLGDHE